MSTSSNKESAVEFLIMCAAGSVREAYEKYVDVRFKHHNAYFKSDRASLMEAMQKSADEEPNKAFRVVQTFVSDDRVAVFSHLQRAQGNTSYAVVHILRFENGKVIEMWDVGQEVPQDSPNELGMF